MAKKIFQYKGENITFEFSDGQRMVNATQMAKPFRKKVNGFLRLSSTKDYIILLEARYADSRNGVIPEVLRVIQGGKPETQGTWMDEKLTLKFAAWLAPAFELWVYDKIEELLKTGATTINVNPNRNIFKTLRLIVDEMEAQSLAIEKNKGDIDYIKDFIFELEAKITSTDENYYSVAGFCSLHGLPCELKQAQKWGKAATILSQKKGFPIGQAHSEVFGTVGTYHKEILQLIVQPI